MNKCNEQVRKTNVVNKCDEQVWWTSAMNKCDEHAGTLDTVNMSIDLVVRHLHSTSNKSRWFDLWTLEEFVVNVRC